MEVRAVIYSDPGDCFPMQLAQAKMQRSFSLAATIFFATKEQVVLQNLFLKYFKYTCKRERTDVAISVRHRRTVSPLVFHISSTTL